LVDVERASTRLRRLEKLIENLEEIRKEGQSAYLAQEPLRLMAERQLTLAVQICTDLGTQLVMERSVRAPESYADVFTAMAEAGLLSVDLASRMSKAARQRNLLIHLYMDIDDREVFHSLESLQDLRDFAEIVGRELS
jgi:uncharacterized protein YutE (UPF0331/DUF86 family)